MADKVSVLAGDECVCACHTDPSIRHAVACCADCGACQTRVRTPVLATHAPTRCRGFRMGRLALKVDAVVCIVAGLAFFIAAFFGAVLPVWLQFVVGAVVALWGVFLWTSIPRPPLRVLLIAAVVVDAVALIALVIIAIVASSTALVTIAWIAAVVVAVFLLWQALTLQATGAYAT